MEGQISIQFKDLLAQASFQENTNGWTCTFSEMKDGVICQAPVCVMHLDNLGEPQIAATLISTMNFLANKDKKNE